MARKKDKKDHQKQITIRTVRDVRGIFHPSSNEKPEDWETARQKTEEAVAREIASEGKSEQS